MKTFADTCLERAEREIEMKGETTGDAYEHIIETMNLLNLVQADSKELCRRLAKAIEAMRTIPNRNGCDTTCYDDFQELADELEAPPSAEKAP